MTELLVHHDSWAYKHSSRNCNTVVLQFSHSVSVSDIRVWSGSQNISTELPGQCLTLNKFSGSSLPTSVSCCITGYLPFICVWDWPHFACQHNVTENSDLVFFIVVMIVLNQLTTGHQLKKLHKPARNLPVPATTTKKEIKPGAAPGVRGRKCRIILNKLLTLCATSFVFLLTVLHVLYASSEKCLQPQKTRFFFWVKMMCWQQHPKCLVPCVHYWLMIAYIALFSALLSRLTALACGSAWVTRFIARFLNIHRSGVLTALAWLVPHETAAVSAQVLCTPYNHAPCHFMQSHIRKVYACLAVTCHLHFWQNDRDFLRATVVTRGWNGSGEENSPAVPAGIRTRDLSITSPAL